MEITEVRIKLMNDPQDRLRGFCSITIDGSFVVRDLKIIHGTRGSFVAMPSRKLTDRCDQCGGKNNLRAAFCNYCGRKLPDERALKDPEGRAKLYADIAHPINPGCRELIQSRVLAAYEQEQILAQQPDYTCRYDEFDLDSDFDSAWDGDPAASPGFSSAAPASVSSRGNQRIEPAASQPIGGPHSKPPAHRARRTPLHARSATSGDNHAEEFGEGIL